MFTTLITFTLRELTKLANYLFPTLGDPKVYISSTVILFSVRAAKASVARAPPNEAPVKYTFALEYFVRRV